MAYNQTMTEQEIHIDEEERNISLVLQVDVPGEELPANETLFVENRVREYLEEEYGIWYHSVDIVIQNEGLSYDSLERFKVAVMD